MVNLLRNTIFISLGWIHTLSAQYQEYVPTHAYGISIGASNYSGDVAEKDIEIWQSEPGFGIFYQFQPNPYTAFSAEYFRGALSGDDKNSPGLAARKIRFFTKLQEFSLQARATYPVGPSFKLFKKEFQFFPLVFAGLAVVVAKPKAEYYGRPEDASASLSTPLPENSIRQYLLPATPFGIGLALQVGEILEMGTKIGMRPVFSDNLDGISINGNPKKQDLYYLLEFNLAYRFKVK